MMTTDTDVWYESRRTLKILEALPNKGNPTIGTIFVRNLVFAPNPNRDKDVQLFFAQHAANIRQWPIPGTDFSLTNYDANLVKTTRDDGVPSIVEPTVIHTPAQIEQILDGLRTLRAES